MNIPTDIVLEMRARGLSNSQIIQALQRSNYTPQQIADAMAQADIKYNVEQTPQQTMEDTYYDQGYAQQPEQASQFDIGSLQALIEAVVEEKWQDLIKNVSRIVDWKEKIDQRIAAIEQQIADLKNTFDKLHSSLLEKIEEYDKTMIGVGTDLKAMEKVFSKILPGFMENVSELSRITEELKGIKKNK
ncbi:MAG: hypothetical protein QXG86_03115 [Candidatus Woesearchaeota archaeon]